MLLRPASSWLGATRRMPAVGFHSAALCRDEAFRGINRAQGTYHPGGFENSLGYRRARKPYLVKNMLGLLALVGFVGGVYTYSIVMVCVEFLTSGGTRRLF